MQIKNILYSKSFERKIKKLYKKYNQIFDDLQNFEKELKQSQEPLGDRLQEFGVLNIYKARVKNSSSNTGKSGGFRVIYCIEQIKGEVSIFIALYSKNEQGNVSRKEIEEILKE